MCELEDGQLIQCPWAKMNAEKNPEAYRKHLERYGIEVTPTGPKYSRMEPTGGGETAQVGAEPTKVEEAAKPESPELKGNLKAIYDAVAGGATARKDVKEKTGLNYNQMQGALHGLKLKGLIDYKGGKVWLAGQQPAPTAKEGPS